MNINDSGSQLPLVDEVPILVKKERVSSDDDEEDVAVPCSNAFMCEVCSLTDDESQAVFKERDDLVLHTFKTHVSTCIGCFESFHTPDDLKKHVMKDNHRLPLCRECWRLFPDQSRLMNHHCQAISIHQEESRDESIDAEESEEEELSIKSEPQSEDEGSEFLCSSEEEMSEESESSGESESDSQVDCSGKSESDDQLDCSGESESDSQSDGSGESELDYGVDDLSCIHCSAKDFNTQHDLRVHTYKAHSSVCIVCFEGFVNEMSLQSHQKALNHIVWKCTECDEVFIIQSLYLRHVTNHHLDDCLYDCSDCSKNGLKKKMLTKLVKQHLKKTKLSHRRKELGGLTTFIRRYHAMKIRLGFRVTKNTCNICFKFFTNSYSLLLHMFREHNEHGQTHMYKCELCQLGFGQAKAFETHLKECHADDMDYLDEARIHVEKYFMKSLNCEDCGERSSNNRNLQRHILSKHPELRPHKCNICGLQYEDNIDVRIHIWIKHRQGKNPFSCPVCSFLVKKSRAFRYPVVSTQILERHLKKCHGYEDMPYMYCFAHKKRFSNESSYEKHYQILHVNSTDFWMTKYPCHICGTEFNLSERVMSYINSPRSNSTGKLKCDSCGKSFKDLICLYMHKENHCNYFKCKICYRAFRKEDELHRHLNAHSGKRPYQCELCGFEVTKRALLQSHLKICNSRDFSRSKRPQTTQEHAIEYRMETEIDDDEEKNTEGKLESKKDNRWHYNHPIPLTNSGHGEREDEGAILSMEPLESQSDEDGSESSYSSTEDSSDESASGSDPEEGDLACIHCIAEGFRNQQHLRVHTFKSHPSVCIVCFEGFDDEDSLHNHQKALHHSVWKCEKCSIFYIRRRHYRVHVTINHPEYSPYGCPDCNWKGFTKRAMGTHRSEVHGYTSRPNKNRTKTNWRIWKSQCNICHKSFMTGYSLVLHMFREHNKPGQTHLYKCELCPFGFGQARAFEIHLKKEHADDTDYLNKMRTAVESALPKSLDCEKCGWRTGRRSSLHRHILSKHPELRPHKCNICGAQFPEESDVRIHVWHDHEGPVGIVCPVCNTSVGTKHDLRGLINHLRGRHGYQSMPFIYCFTHKRRMERFQCYQKHFELHHLDPADRPVRAPVPTTGFPCNLCSKEFGSSSKLQQHVNRVHLHSGEKLKCDVCGGLFKDIFVLNSHKLKHTDKFKCKICNKTFEMQCHLDRHQVVHSGEKPFQCEVCGLKVSQRSSLQRHVKVVHGNDKPVKSLKPRRTRGPKHEERMKKQNIITDKQVNETENISTENQAMPTEDTGNKCARSMKRPRCSKSPTVAAMLPKRKRGRPRVDTDSETSDQSDHDDVEMKLRRRSRPRMAKEKAEGQLHLQTALDDDYIVLDDEEIFSDNRTEVD